MQRVVIILVNFNSHEDTVDCLESLARCKKLNIDLYVVVVDNASRDASTLDLFPEVFSPCHVIRNTENIGFGRANNIGIRWAQENLDPDFICLLNNDTVVEPDFLKYLILPFTLYTSVGITTGKIHYHPKRKELWYNGAEVGRKTGWPKTITNSTKLDSIGREETVPVSFISGCLMMFSRESLLKLQGFDDEYFMYCEDIELSIRASEHSFGLYYNPKSIIYHKVGGSQDGASEHKGLDPLNPNFSFHFRHKFLNRYITYRKHWSYFRHPYVLISYFLKLFGKTAERIIKTNQMSVAMRDLYWVLSKIIRSYLK